MANSVAYLTSRANFTQVSPDIPITKQRNPEKVDAPDVFEGTIYIVSLELGTQLNLANKKEMVNDLMVKAKQIEFLINSLPEPETEENQVCCRLFSWSSPIRTFHRHIDFRSSSMRWSRRTTNTYVL